ncbi:amidohydrolase family protein [Proteobacteria bacterium 005FR1]|nr:amidohydrolase family protein [Proteobacteria bacterium 005FR1]
MAYAEKRMIHDADSHIMEVPGMLESYMEARYLADFTAKTRPARSQLENAEKALALQDDPSFRAGDEENILLRKNHQALGSFRAEDRSKALDYLGFKSQLVFTTYVLSNFGLEYSSNTDLAIASATAHNRMMADFCSVDRRLLATAYVPLVDVARAAEVAESALKLGCKALVIPSRCPAGHSPSHVGFDRLWAVAQESGVPVLFHVGGEEKMNDAYAENGLPRVKDFHGGDENFTSTSFMTIPLSLWQTMAVLILDGVCDRFPNLKFGAVELGASWLPSWLRFIDAACAAFRKGEERLKKLSDTPSNIAKRQLRITPYPHEDVGWIIANSSEDMCMFSSDYPHIEGGRNPIKRFDESLEGSSTQAMDKFYRANFEDLMGAGLAADLRANPAAASVS